MIPGLSLSGRIDLAGNKLARTDVRDWLARAAVWFEAVGDTVLAADLAPGPGDRLILYVTFHPAAPDVEVRLGNAGAIRVTAVTGPAGPGYHAHLAGVLAAFAADFDIAWEQIDDPTGYARTTDLDALKQACLSQLRHNCRTAIAAGLPAAVGLPADHGFTHPGPILTPLGPRTPDWLLATATDPHAGFETIPWWHPEPNANFYLNRALHRLWCDYPWRPPLTDDEGEIADQIAADLEEAHARDPHAVMPWAAWASVLADITWDAQKFTVQEPDHALKAEVVIQAASAGPTTIGYRRFPVRVAVCGGWTLEMPGDFAETWIDHGHTWVGWNATRKITARISPDLTHPLDLAFEGFDRDAIAAVWRTARPAPRTETSSVA